MKTRHLRIPCSPLCYFIVLMFPFWSIAVSAQSTTLFADGRYGITFQPPAGWEKDESGTGDVRVQYLGPRRENDTRAAMNLAVEETAPELDGPSVDVLAEELIEELSSRGFPDPKVTETRETSVAGLKAVDIEIVYGQQPMQMRMRQTYVPVAPQNRTYIFTIVDLARHFDESARIARNSIETFSPGETVATSVESTGARSSRRSNWFWITVGVIAAAVVVGASYLLFQRQKAGA